MHIYESTKETFNYDGEIRLRPTHIWVRFFGIRVGKVPLLCSPNLACSPGQMFPHLFPVFMKLAYLGRVFLAARKEGRVPSAALQRNDRWT